MTGHTYSYPKVAELGIDDINRRGMTVYNAMVGSVGGLAVRLEDMPRSTTNGFNDLSVATPEGSNNPDQSTHSVGTEATGVDEYQSAA
jgi:hypothetical protein